MELSRELKGLKSKFLDVNISSLLHENTHFTVLNKLLKKQKQLKGKIVSLSGISSSFLFKSIPDGREKQERTDVSSRFFCDFVFCSSIRKNKFPKGKFFTKIFSVKNNSNGEIIYAKIT